MWYSNLSSFIPDGQIVEGLFSDKSNGYSSYMKRNDVKIKLLYFLCLLYVIWTIVKLYFTISDAKKSTKEKLGLFSGKIAPPFAVIQLLYAIRLSQYLGTVAVTNNKLKILSIRGKESIAALTDEEERELESLKPYIKLVRNMKAGEDLPSPLNLKNLKKFKYCVFLNDLKTETDSNSSDSNTAKEKRKECATKWILSKIPKSQQNLKRAVILYLNMESEEELDEKITKFLNKDVTKGFDTHMFHEVANVSILMAVLTLSLYLVKQLDTKTFWIEFIFSTIVYSLSRNLFIDAYDTMMSFFSAESKCYNKKDSNSCKKDSNCFFSNPFCIDAVPCSKLTLDECKDAKYSDQCMTYKNKCVRKNECGEYKDSNICKNDDECDWDTADTNVKCRKKCKAYNSDDYFPDSNECPEKYCKWDSNDNECINK